MKKARTTPSNKHLNDDVIQIPGSNKDDVYRMHEQKNTDDVIEMSGVAVPTIVEEHFVVGKGKQNRKLITAMCNTVML